jgi:hypothetical protein
MKRTLVLCIACALGACGGGGATSGGPVDAGALTDGVATDATPDSDAVDAAVAPVLSLSLDPMLDQPDDDVKVTSITDAKLLDRAGGVKTNAVIASGSAVFALAGLSAGDYFIVLNSDPDDPIPTRIDDPASSVIQTVGQKLRASYIGPPGAPVYRINTYSAGQKESGVAKYSDGTIVSGEQPYVVYSFATSQLEIRRLDTGALLTSLPLSKCVGHAYVPADAWLLNTTNQDHHGDLFKADGGAADCQTCHWAGGMKKYAVDVITPTDGWCYRCHYGTSGSAAGFIDPAQ